MKGKREGMKERIEEGRKKVNRIMKGKGVKGMKVFGYRRKGREEEGKKERKVLE